MRISMCFDSNCLKHRIFFITFMFNTSEKPYVSVCMAYSNARGHENGSTDLDDENGVLYTVCHLLFPQF